MAECLLEMLHQLHNMDKNEKELLLDLSTDSVKAHIKIDDVPYGLCGLDDLSITSRQKLNELGTQLSSVGEINTDDDEERYNAILQSLLYLVIIEINPEILQKLSITKKIEIVNAYMEVNGLLKKKTE